MFNNFVADNGRFLSCVRNSVSRSTIGKRKVKNIAVRLPENSRNSFVDLQSQKKVKKADQKNQGLKCLYLIRNLYKFLPPILAALK